MAHVQTRKQMRNDIKRKQNTSTGFANVSAGDLNSSGKNHEEGELDDSQPLLSQDQEDFDEAAEDALIETVLDSQPSWKARLTNQISPETQEALSKSRAKRQSLAEHEQSMTDPLRQDTQLHSAQVTPSLTTSFNNLQFGNAVSRIEHSASFNQMDTSRSVFQEGLSEAAGHDAIQQQWLQRQQTLQQQDRMQDQQWLQ